MKKQIKSRFFEGRKIRKDYIWARFDNNSNETVTIFVKNEAFISNTGSWVMFSMKCQKAG